MFAKFFPKTYIRQIQDDWTVGERWFREFINNPATYFVTVEPGSDSLSEDIKRDKDAYETGKLSAEWRS